MKKIYIIAFSFVLVTFILITVIKLHRSTQNTEENGDLLLSAEKEKIQTFWEIYRRANEQRIKGRLAEAAKGYESALLYDEKHEDALYYLGNVYIDLGKYDKAQTCWKKLIMINPGSARAHFQLGNLYLNYVDENYFDINLAGEYFQRVLRINKEESGALYCMGQVELILGNYDKARHIFDALSGSNYNNPGATFFNSYLDWQAGNTDLAISRLSVFIKGSVRSVTAKTASAEGDTKDGKPLYNTLSSGHKTLFDDYVSNLPELTGPDARVNFEKRCNGLKAYLIQLRVKI